MTSTLLEVENCHTYYGAAYVLQGVSLTLQPGQVVALIGRNGMGKTTLVRSIMGLSPPRQGRIRLRDHEISSMRPERIARLGLGLVPQGRGIFPSLRVHENLRVASRARGGKGWTLDWVYWRFPNLKERASSWGDQLSGGEQQMLAIGRALVTNPECILMDEPFEGLGPAVVHDVLGLISELASAGMGVLLVEQHVDAAVGVADHVLVMGKGTIAFSGTPAEFLDRPHLRADYFGVT